MIPIYQDMFSSKEDIEHEFEVNLPENCEILFASYDVDGYDGAATVIFRINGELFEVHGSHCSCFGLEDQWEPETTSVEYFLRQAAVQKEHNFKPSSYPSTEEWELLAEYCSNTEV